jgi:hypothetical protein
VKYKVIISAVSVLCVCFAQQALADTAWNWRYTGANISADGILTVSDAVDAEGFHQIVAITGQRNGEAITALYPTGSAIPGNEPYELDNLVRIGANGQITVHGFGFSTASGSHANPYYADFLAIPTYAEVFTSASGFSEVPITFTASPVPEAHTLLLMLAGLGTGSAFTAWRRRNA